MAKQDSDAPPPLPGDLKAAALSSLAELRSGAKQLGQDARGTLTTIASDARERAGTLVQQQKALGADQLSDLARAAQTAAGDLDRKTPGVASLVRDVASSVDRLADELRSGEVRDAVTAVSAFARRQPIAFFAGSVLAGFALARLLKGDGGAATGEAVADRTGPLV